MKQPSIVFVGHVCIDHNISEHTRYTDWGSGVLYMADFAQKRLGVTPTVLTRYGIDFLHYRAEFNLWPRRPHNIRTLVYKNITDVTGRVQYCHFAAKALPPTLDVHARKILAEADIVVLASLLPNYSVKYVQKLLKYCRSDCLKVCCPQGYFRSVDGGGIIKPRQFIEAAELVPLFDLTIISEDDHPEATAQAHTWKHHTPAANIVITRGPNGASIVTPTGEEQIKTKSVAEDDVVDSVGCGDVFAMMAAYKFYETRDLGQAILSANEAARKKLLALTPAAIS